MKYRKLGNSGLIVSEVGLGTMQFGEAVLLKLDSLCLLILTRVSKLWTR